ncbi:major facilitator superfamily domain-containing protein [Pelagophyceae sp. CCMP2097]|nr:major facilitator superfamily domain-containing protein [Pelagophyceae sp. CCMP2097]|mmetsp:Transcript_9037/g.29847  ORF Transcript_9037/g.29847 Transcript_9037/m.29847 type:complete len:517 (+) Transcript_9037:36-1586(+)
MLALDPTAGVEFATRIVSKVYSKVDSDFLRKNAATGVGSILEWYDFAIFGAFADVLAEVLFPPGDNAMLQVLAVYGSAFLMRPIGALLIGAIADSQGRKFALELSIICMTVPTFLIAALPTFALGGYWTVACLVSLRLAQGLFVGGELPTALIFIAENTPERRDAGIFSALQFTFINVGSLMGLAIALFFRSVLSGDDLKAFGWRICFGLGLPLGLLGLMLRRGLADEGELKVVDDDEKDDPAAEATCVGDMLMSSKTQRSLLRPVADAWRHNTRPMLAVTGIYALWTATFNSFLVWYPLGLRMIGVGGAFDLIVSGLAALTILTLGTSLLTRVHDACPMEDESLIKDAGARGRSRFARTRNARTTYKVGAFILVTTVPLMFVVLDETRSFGAAAALLGCASVGLACVAAGVPFIAAMAFDPEVRVLGVGAPLNVSSAVFGGFAPLAAAALFDVRPSLVGVLTAVSGLIGILALRDLEWQFDADGDDDDSTLRRFKRDVAADAANAPPPKSYGAVL